MGKFRTRQPIINIVSIIAIILSISAGIFSTFLIAEIKYELILSVLFAILGVALGTITIYILGKIIQKRKDVKIYIAYSQKDEGIARSLSVSLREDGYTILSLDEILKVGDDIAKKLVETIEDSDFMIVLLSRDSIKSEYVQREMDLAFKGKMKIFPVMFGDVELPEILKDVVYVRIDKEPSKAYKYLEKSIRESVPEYVKK